MPDLAPNPSESRVDRSRHKESCWGPVGQRPRLLVDQANPDLTVAALRDILSSAPNLYDRGVPVRLAVDGSGRGGAFAQVMSADDLVLVAHQVCRPFALGAKGGAGAEVDVQLPTSIARMYLGWRGEWRLPPLNGIASAPLLREDGSILSGGGYDPATGIWQEDVPDLTDRIPVTVHRRDALEALRKICRAFRTFCFADANTVFNSKRNIAVVDIDAPPGRDESGFLAALITAICRPSLPLAPGILLRAAPMSGAGTGKGLLARIICLVAFGREPHAVTSGASAEELEKRIAAELMQGNAALFLDNLNNATLRSNLLASAITERPSRVRLLGHSRMLPLNATAFVVLTGNGLSVSEDLARRFVSVNLDAKMEDPESRPFSGDIKARVAERRAELLAATLTIWRWGRQANDITPGRSLGSFEMWCRWVRDPLVTLGCRDPAERIGEAKFHDARRQAIADLFSAWWGKHGGRPVAIRDLHPDVKDVADPHGRGRQYLASHLGSLAGARLAGFVLTRQEATGKWGAATFALRRHIQAKDP